jgi:hypothetical protein
MRRNEITPDDVVIIKGHDLLTDQQARNLEQSIRRFFGVKKILFLDGGLDIEVVRPVSTFVQQVEDALEKGE